MTRMWMTDLRSSAGQYVRMDAARAAFAQPGASLFSRAIGLALALTMAVVALVVIVPLLVLAGVLFLCVFAYLQIKRLVGGMLGRVLPRSDGRQNVRVRLPSETAE
jgi:hypothetical protein